MKIFRSSVVLAVMSLSLGWLTIPAYAVDAPAAPTAAPLCRLGINTPAGDSGNITQFDTAALRIGWYIDYVTRAAPARPNGIAYTQVIHLRDTGTGYASNPDRASIQQIARANPGSDWIIGNEPDRIQVQDDIKPEIYALAYHDLYYAIKQADPTAQVFAGAIVQPTPIRLEYLDLVLQSYEQRYDEHMPADGWSIHNFILNEASCEHYQNNLNFCWGADIPPGVNATDGLRVTADDNDRMDLFVAQIVRFREWLVSRGHAGKPVYLTEYGVLMPENFGFPPSRVNAYMNETLDYLLSATDRVTGDPTDGYRLIQKVAWYSTNDEEFNGYLFHKPDAKGSYVLTEMGQNWVEYANALTPTTDLYPVSLSVSPPAPLASRGQTTFTLSARLANSGDLLAAQSFKVRFYNGNPAQGGQQIGSEQTLSLAGCGMDDTVSVVWRNVKPGRYRVYVQVDPQNRVAESNEQNNLLSTEVFFANRQIFMPRVRRPVFLH